jgi:hypothetical protein
LDAEDVATAMAHFAMDVLCALHAGDSGFEQEIAGDQCILAARRAVFNYAGLLTDADYQAMAQRR